MTKRESNAEILRFSGCWNDMTDEEFEDFLAEIKERRRQASSQRMSHESIMPEPDFESSLPDGENQ